MNKKILQSFNGDELASTVFENKYALKDLDDNILEFSLDDTKKRLKNEMIKIDENLDYDFLLKYFLPAGRILAALGNWFQPNTTFSNCYYVPIKDDSISSIYEATKEQAILFSRGGGCGLDISNLRPKGAPVNNAAKTTSGAVSFMDLFSSTTGLIGQSGRRGATAVTIDISHPDVIDFIKVKGGKDKTKIQYANISVKFSDKFFNQLINEPDSDWEMYFTLENGKTIFKYEKIKIIWDLFVESNYFGSEPGILFWDKVKNNQAGCFKETISKGINPCFTGDTKVCLADGKKIVKTFNELVYTDNGKDVDVYCKNNNNELVIRTMRNPRKTQSNCCIWELTLNNGDLIKATGNHKFRKINNEWSELQNLKINDDILSIDTDNILSNVSYKVINVTKTNYKEDVYCGTVDDFHNFFVGNIDNKFVNVANCGEQNLADYGSCNLGSLNLNAFVENSFINPTFNYNNLIKATKEAVKFLSNINTLNYDRHPLEGNRKSIDYENKIGLGFTGMADMLIRMNLKYDSDESINFIDSMLKLFKNASIEASIDLAAEKGCCGILKKYAGTIEYDNFINHKVFNDLTPLYKEKLKKYGIYNQSIQTIAPNGSISIILQTASGLEPIYALSYNRKIKEAGEEKEYVVYHQLVKEYNLIFGKDAHLKNENFITAKDIKWEKRIEMQSTIQKYIDNSISSTVNLPNEVTKETISNIYIEAWKQGLKGITVYRDGSRDGILTETKKSPHILEHYKFPKEQNAIMKVIKSENKKWYVTYTIDDETKLPNSLFVNTNSTETNILTENVLEQLEQLAEKYIKNGYLEKLKKKHKNQSNVTKIARTLSLLLRHRIPIVEIIKTIEIIKPPIFSFVFQIKKLLSIFLDGDYTGEKCPECESQMIYEGGCKICKNCGWSKC